MKDRIDGIGNVRYGEAMSDKPHEPKPAPAKGQGKGTPADVTNPAAAEPEASRPLTPEEQMAAFEKDLRENDWGHQPC